MHKGKISIKLAKDGIGRRSGQECVAGLVMGGVAPKVSPTVPNPAQLNTPYILYSKQNAVDLGLDSAYDLANQVLVAYHICEYFRMNPGGELHIMLVAQGTTMTDMADPTMPYLQTLLQNANGSITQAGVVLNPPVGYVDAITGGFNADAYTAVAMAQTLADSEFNCKRPIDNIMIEGRCFTPPVSTVQDLQTMQGGPFPNSSVVIAQDPYISTQDKEFEKTAAIGTALGAACNRDCHENMANPIDQFNLTEAATGEFLEPYHSGHAAMSTLGDADIEALDGKNYIFACTIPSYSGVYFNGMWNAAPRTSDLNSVECLSVINKAIRLVYQYLVPWICRTVEVTPAGRLSPIIRATIQGEIQGLIETNMINNISEVRYVIADPDTDPDGNVLIPFAKGGCLNIQIGIVKKGKVECIDLCIGYTLDAEN